MLLAAAQARRIFDVHRGALGPRLGTAARQKAPVRSPNPRAAETVCLQAWLMRDRLPPASGRQETTRLPPDASGPGRSLAEYRFSGIVQFSRSCRDLAGRLPESAHVTALFDRAIQGLGWIRPPEPAYSTARQHAGAVLHASREETEHPRSLLVPGRRQPSQPVSSIPSRRCWPAFLGASRSGTASPSHPERSPSRGSSAATSSTPKMLGPIHWSRTARPT